MEKTHDICLDFLALSTKKLASTIFFQTFQSRDMSPENKLVDGLNELIVHLLDLQLLLGPVVSIGRDFYTMYVFVILDQGFYRVWCKLECDLVPEYHVDMDDICFDVKELIVEQCFNQRVLILAQFRVRRFCNHDGGKSPYRCRGR